MKSSPSMNGIPVVQMTLTSGWMGPGMGDEGGNDQRGCCPCDNGRLFRCGTSGLRHVTDGWRGRETDAEVAEMGVRDDDRRNGPISPRDGLDGMLDDALPSSPEEEGEERISNLRSEARSLISGQE